MSERQEPARSKALEQLSDYFQSMAGITGKNPDLASETALWSALADEVETYLRPPAAAAEPSLFDEGPS